MERNWCSGFTLVEVLVAFSFLLIIISLFPLMIKSIPIIKNSNVDLRPFEIQIFFNQLSMEVREAKEISINGTTLVLVKSDGTQITVEKYQDKVRRRVNGVGHDLFLQRITSISYMSIPGGVQVNVEGSNGKKYTRNLYQLYLLGGDTDKESRIYTTCDVDNDVLYGIHLTSSNIHV